MTMSTRGRDCPPLVDNYFKGSSVRNFLNQLSLLYDHFQCLKDGQLFVNELIGSPS